MPILHSSKVLKLMATPRLKRQFSNQVYHIITIDEASFYLQQAIELAYESNGTLLPKELDEWTKKGIKINFSLLPKNIQDGITGILYQSPLGKKVVEKIIINLPK